MKRHLLCLGFALFCLSCSGQNSMTDSLRNVLNGPQPDTARAKTLYLLSYYYQFYKPDSALLLAKSAYTLSAKAGFLRGQINSLGQMAGAYNKLGNYLKALETFIEQIKLLEKQKDMESIATAYLSIALVYSSQKDFQKALYYAYRADSIAHAEGYHDLRLYTTLDIGDMYSKNNQLDSALFFTKLSFDSSIAYKNDLITGTALNNLGNIFFKSGEYNKAIVNYTLSLPIIESMQDYNTLSECYLGLAQTYEALDNTDSSLYYADKSYRLASENQFLQHAINASRFLTDFYKEHRIIDSAFSYQEKYIAFKDSFANAEKIRQFQSSSISEQFRQDDITREKVRQDKQRRLKLELLLIGMLIPVFFFLSAFISRKKVNRRVIELSGIFSLIFLFEYITFLIHPVIKDKAMHSPVFEILIFVTIAAILSPTHHRVEYWLIRKLTKKHYPDHVPTRGHHH
jgi:tetratricopeptide (TPR) repeat protein